jgi:uncharacterized membrane protein
MLLKINQWFHKSTLIVLFIAVIGYAVIFSVLSITRHEHYSSQGWDLALYEQIIWKYSQGKIAYSSLINRLDLADRFRPTMLLAVPLYKVLPDTKTLLIFQAGLIASSAIPVFLLAVRKTKNHFLSLTIAAASLLFVGSQSLTMNDFHELAFLPVFIALIFFFLDKKQWGAYFLTVILALGVREYVGFIIGAIGISLFFMKIPKKVALITCVLGFIWSISVILIIMPQFGQNSYKGFLGGGQGFDQELIYIITNPKFLLYNLLQPNVKINTLFVSFASFGFLPLLYPPLLLPILTQFLLRFLDLSHPYRWTYYYQYSADLAILLAIATIYANPYFEKILNRIKIMWIRFPISYLLLLSLIITQILVATPIKLLIHKEFFQAQPYMADNNQMLNHIPPNASLATQNSLASHLAKRDQLSILPDINNAEYIALDLHPNQDRFNFYSLTDTDMKDLLIKLQKDNYMQIYNQGDAYLLKKIDK